MISTTAANTPSVQAKPVPKARRKSCTYCTSPSHFSRSSSGETP